MSDQIDGGAPAAAPQAADFIGGFAPGSSSPDPLFTSAPAPEEAPANAEAAPAPAKAEEKPSPLSELIRQQREERRARETEAKAAADAKARVAELEAEVARLRSQEDPLADPAGWARGRKLTPEQQLLLGQSLLYDLAPDKAPQDLRFKLFEQKVAREKAAEEAARKEAAEKAAEQARQQQIDSYVAGLRAAAQSFQPGSFPESEAWFAGPQGQVDHENYTRSLFATANNMAMAAQRAGKVADLSPGTVAAVLEAEVAARLARRDARRAGAPRKQEAATAAAAEQAAAVTTSTKGLGASGAPRSPAMSDEERVRRASEVLFRTR